MKWEFMEKLMKNNVAGVWLIKRDYDMWDYFVMSVLDTFDSFEYWQKNNKLEIDGKTLKNISHIDKITLMSEFFFVFITYFYTLWMGSTC